MDGAAGIEGALEALLVLAGPHQLHLHLGDRATEPAGLGLGLPDRVAGGREIVGERW